MEEDVEIELLLKYNEELLMQEASSLKGDENNTGNECKGNMSMEYNTSIAEDNIEKLDQEESLHKKPNQEKNNENTTLTQKLTNTVDNNEGINYNDEVQELLDDHIVSYMAKNPSKDVEQFYSGEENEISDYESDEGDQFINEIMSQSQQYEGRFMEDIKQLLGSKNLQTNYSVIKELASAYKLILERDRLLKNLEYKFQEKLYTIEENIQHVRESITSITVQNGSNIKTTSHSRSYFKLFGSPYFKDFYGFGPHCNPDHLAKLHTGQLPVVSVEKPHFWTEDRQKKLLDGIRETLETEKTDVLIKRINKLKSMLICCQKKETNEELEEKLAVSHRELHEIKKKSFEELISGETQDREYDWMKYSASIFHGEHSSDECKRFWEVYLKPSINKSNWVRKEDLKMINIAEQTELQDWDYIAKSLGTNRSPYQCFIHFQTRLNTTHNRSKGKWSREEDQKLLNTIKASKVGDFIPWAKVCFLIEGRTRPQIYNRYRNCLDPKLVKGRFTKGEDLLIAAGLEVFGCNYRELSSLLKTRSANQIRDRYNRYILPNSVKVGSWTLAEDNQLMKLVDRYGDQNWCAISKEMKIRTRTQVRHRYRIIKQSTENGCTIANLKRRSKNTHFNDKSLTRTKNSVEKIKLEIDKVEQSLNLTKIEKDVFRMDKLKALRDKFLKNKKFKQKTNVSIKDLQVNDWLLQFFKHYRIKPPQSTQICNYKEYKNYFKEFIFLAKIVGHELKIPHNEDKILNNPKLGNDLKNVLLESNNIKNIYPSLQSIGDAPNSIDYIPHEYDTSLIMNECWFIPSMQVSSLNFSEFFKPTVFDYSCGMHKDIWDSKMKRDAQIHLSAFENNSCDPPSIIEQELNMPPNLITTLGFKYVLLSKSRLKQDCKKMAKESFPENYDTKIEKDINYCLDGFQETLLTLFTWPGALSLCDVPEFLKSRKKNSVRGKKISRMPSDKTVKKGKNKQGKQYNSKQRESKMSRIVKKKRKTKKEQLITDKKEEIDKRPVKSTVSAVFPQSKRLNKLKSNDENKSPVDGFGTKKNKEFIDNNEVYSKKAFGYKNHPKFKLSVKDLCQSTPNSSENPLSKTYCRQQKRKAEPEITCIPSKKSNVVSTEVESCLEVVE